MIQFIKEISDRKLLEKLVNLLLKFKMFQTILIDNNNPTIKTKDLIYLSFDNIIMLSKKNIKNINFPNINIQMNMEAKNNIM